jgi:hypothetical protein
MSEVTCLIDAAAAGDPKAVADLLPLVHDELRKLAAARMAEERPGQTLQATALVHAEAPAARLERLRISGLNSFGVRSRVPLARFFQPVLPTAGRVRRASPGSCHRRNRGERGRKWGSR